MKLYSGSLYTSNGFIRLVSPFKNKYRPTRFHNIVFIELKCVHYSGNAYTQWHAYRGRSGSTGTHMCASLIERRAFGNYLVVMRTMTSDIDGHLFIGATKGISKIKFRRNE